MVSKGFIYVLGEKSKDTNKKILESYHRFQKRIYTKKEKNILIVKFLSKNNEKKLILQNYRYCKEISLT